MKTVRITWTACVLGLAFCIGCGAPRPLVAPGTPHTSVSDREIKERVDTATGELGTAADSVDQYSNE